MSDQFWQYFFGFLGMAFIAYMQYRTKAAVTSAAAESKVGTDKVAEALVATTSHLDDKLVDISNMGQQNHMLLNSAMGAQKKALAVTARAKANITHDPVDIKAAEVAEADLLDHERKQAALDSHQAAQPQIDAIQKVGDDTNAKVTDLKKP